MSARRILISALAISAFTTAAYAQSVVSAHSGTLHYFDGVVSIDGKAVEQHPGKFPEIKDNSVFRTEFGRAEILLTPGVFLRLGEKSAIKVLDNRLMSTRIEFLEGSAMVESDGQDSSVKDPAVTIIYKDYSIQPIKFGLFELSSSAGLLRVYKGQASVEAGGSRVVVKEGRQVPFSAALLAEKVDEKNIDDLYLWTRDRSAHLSAANMASARSVANQSLMGGGFLNGMGVYNPATGYPGFGGGWYYNPYLGMYTYMPRSGTVWSPFGYGYFSPGTIFAYYSPDRYYWSGGGGARNGVSTGVPLTNIGTSGVAASQVARFGSGINSHPTLSSPVRSSEAPGMNSTGFRGAGDFGGGNFGGPGSGGRFGNAAPSVSSNTGGTQQAPVSAPAAAPAASGGAPGGARGR